MNPANLAKSCRGGKGRRPWRSHKPRHAGSIPASATNSRFVQWKDGGPTNRTRGFDSLTGYQIGGGRRQTARREAVNLVLTGSTPVAHPKPLRVVGQSAAHLPRAQARGGSSPPDPTICSACRVVATATRPAVNRKDPGSNPGPTANVHLAVPRRGRAAMRPPLSGTKLVRLQPAGPRRRSVAGSTAPS